MDEVTLRPLADADREDAIALLRDARLPTTDIASLRGFTGAFRGGRLVGCVGLEEHGAFRFLRSLVVAPEERGTGLGRRLAEDAVAQARGARAIYLLTESTATFFERLGFERVDRASVPAEVARNPQFTSTCPSSAACLVRVLDGA
jgi:N-acetylglutamate synthase-like GNAT family acetyltransferase